MFSRRVLAIIILFLSACTSTLTKTQNINPSSTAQIRLTPTSEPTVTPIPDVNLDSFIFPYDIEQVMGVWAQLSFPVQDRYITYHIVNKSDRSIPYENPCGYHPGDQINILGSNKYYEDFLIDVQLPYSGTLVNSWITQGNDDGFTFFIGNKDGKEVYLNSYHTQESHNNIGQTIQQGDVYGSYTYTRDHCNCGYYEDTVHLTLFNPSPTGSIDFLDNINVLDITSFALPPSMQAAYQNDLRLLIVYEGPNSCDMNAQQKIDAILSTYLPNAGFCIEGQRISYCGKNTNYNGLVFTYTRWNDSRSIMLRPSK